MKFTKTNAIKYFTIVAIVVGVLFLALGGFLSPVYRLALNPVINAQRWLSSRYIGIYEYLTSPSDVASLRQKIQSLEAEVSELQSQVVEYQQKNQESQALNALLGFARENPESQYVAGSEIGRDPSPFMHYIIIDRGSDHGLRRGMPVVTQQGLIGKIDAVTSVAARILLISDPNSKVNIRIQSSGMEAVLVGSITGELSLQFIPQDADIQIGDVVLTSGIGGGYSENLMVGQVVGTRKQEFDLFQEVTVQPVVDFSTITLVLVITNYKPIDIQPLIPTAVP